MQLGIGTWLLQKLGWNFGQGLGKANEGPVRPIVPEVRDFNAGLGFKAAAKKEGKKGGREKRPPPPAALVESLCEACGETITGMRNIKEHRKQHGKERAKEKRKKRKREGEEDESENEKNEKDVKDDDAKDAIAKAAETPIVKKLPGKLAAKGFKTPRRINE
jgi:hypothetical protein